MLNTVTDLDFLIPELRLHMRDVTPPYKYEDELLRQCLVTGFKILGRRWHYRYLMDGNYVVTRNKAIISFKTTESPVIEYGDQAILVLQAAIILKSAECYDSTWDVASWRDDEIYYSNVQGASIRNKDLEGDKNLLELLLKERLYPGKVQALPGFHLPKNMTEGTL